MALRLRQHLDAGVLQDRSESYYPTLTFETAVSKSDFFGLHLNHANRRYAARTSMVQRQEAGQCFIV